MSKNPKDNELVKKGAVKEILLSIPESPCRDIFETIDNLPAEPQGKDSWVLGELKKWISIEKQQLKGEAPNSRHWLGLFELHIQNLQSQAPGVRRQAKSGKGG